MPTETFETPVAETTEKTEDSFASYLAKRGGSAPEPESPKPAEPATPAKPETASETAPASEPESEQSRADKRKKQIQTQIDDLTKQRETLRREVTSLTVPRGTEAPKDPATASAAPKDDKDPQPAKPDIGKYQNWGEYDADMEKWREQNAAWIARQEWRKMETERTTRTAAEESQAAYREALESFESRGSEYAASHPDYPERVKEFKNKSLTDETAACILEAENGPEILDYLMENPEEFKKIEALKYRAKRTDAIYALKYKLLGYGQKAAPAEIAPKRSSAPAPGTRPTGNGAPSKDATSFEAFRKQRAG